MRYRIGVDIGGTFTDCVVISDNGAIHTFKELSTPEDQSIGLYNVIKKAAEFFGLDLNGFLGGADLFAHGTTVATNTLLTGTGAKTGLILTKGFRDTLEMRRAHKDNIWDLFLYTPAPLVPRYLRCGVTERLDYLGREVVPLNEEEVIGICADFRKEGVTAVAICTLFSYLNAAHEKRIREIVERELPGVFVSHSGEVLPQIREYERQSTTVANAYVGPKLTVYLRNLEQKLKSDGLKKAFYVVASNGGMMTADTAIRHASATLLSGPAAGATGAVFFAGLTGSRNLILMDMGGTSFDVSLINDGEISLSTEGEIAGYRVAKPMIDIHTIGAGGGSVAWIDKWGMLKVGPESAYSNPGPVCYDRGGEKPTVTDANLLLGYLNKDFFLGGEMQINYDKCRAMMQEKVAGRMGLSVEKAAAGIFRIVNQSMADATKVVSVQKGYDPREFALVSAGGACSIHACKIAEEVGAKQVIVPMAASVFCALGMLESDIRLDNVRSFSGVIPGLDLDGFNAVIASTEKTALAELLSEGVQREDVSLERYLDIRYVGQHHEVTVPMPSGRAITAEHVEEIAATFHAAHERLYSYSTPETPMEIVNLRVTGVGHVAKTTLEKQAAGSHSESEAIKNERELYFEEYGDWRRVPVYDRGKLYVGHKIAGPAVIEERITTVVVHPNWNARIDEFGNIVMEVKA
ncbi:MAG: hydantoinase/oxoprolinase family protein [Christensenellaceae bacterium]|jgi:N-methylhydantoinase A|nr:hydantoinase/oxoprolinase family protein [Christensenellaceae bacterium]